MKTRIAVVAIIVDEKKSVEQVNYILHEYADFVIARLGVPYRERGVNIISIVIDATENDINALSGKIGKISGVSAKTVYSNIFSE